MAEVNTTEVLKKMLEAAKAVFNTQWKEVKPYAEQEFKAFTQNIQMINKLKEKGKITEAQAKLYFENQNLSIRIVLLSLEGISLVTIENAINAAINVVKDTVNTAIGWTIL